MKPQNKDASMVGHAAVVTGLSASAGVDEDSESSAAGAQSASEVFGRALYANQGRVVRLCQHLVGGRRDDAVELAQETMVQALRTQHRYDRSRPFRPWLFQIAINVCRNYRRAKARREVPSDLPPSDDAMWHQEAPNAQRLTERREDARRIHNALNHLKDSDRELVLLRHCEGLSYSELASIYRLPSTILKMRVHRALKRMRAALSGEAP